MSTVGASSASSGTRGYIEAIEVENFKSYQGKHLIGPLRDFTCIVGPNGSGKSNVMDAISFVLGIKTANMRAAQLKDLVYSVSAPGAVTPSKAIVRLRFVTSTGKHLLFERSVTSSGTATYYVDGKAAPWTKYEEILRSQNILASTRNCLIFQGEVEAMAHKNPMQITEMIELVAGSSELKKEYEAKKAAHDAAVDRVRIVSKEKRGVGAEHTELRHHKEEAARYHSLMHDLSALKVDHALLQFYHLESGLVKMAKLQETAKANLAAEEQVVVEKEKTFVEAKQAATSLYKEVHEKTRAERTVQHEANQTKRNVVDADVRHKTFAVELKRLQDQMEKAEGEKTACSARVGGLQKDLKEQQLILQRHDEACRREDEEGDLSATDRAEFLKLRAQAQAATVGLTQDLAQQQREVDHTKHQLGSLEEVERDQVRRLTAAEERLASLEARKEEAESKRLSETQEEAGWNAELTETRGAAERKRQELQKKEVVLRDVTEEVGRLRAERDEGKSSSRMNTALESMKELFGGVHGRLCDLVKIPNSQHRVAVAVAMGKHMDAVVTDTDRTAHACVQYLKDQRIGTMNFIPLSTIRAAGRDVSDEHRMLGGTAKPVVDCITYDSKLRLAVIYAIGQCILCSSIEEGQRVAWEGKSRQKVVTLDGTVMQKNGVMTGGAAGMEARALKFDQKDVQKDLETKKEKRDKLAQEIRALHLDILRTEEKSRELSQQVDEENRRRDIAKEDLKRWEERRKAAEAEVAGMRKEAGSLLPKKKELQKQLDAAEARAATAEAKVRSEEAKVFGDFGERVNIKDIRAYDARMLTKEKDRAAKSAAVRSLIVKIQAQIEYEQKSERSLSPEQVKETLAAKTREAEACLADLKAKKKAADGKEKQLGDLKKELEKKAAELRKQDQMVVRVKRELNTALAQCEEIRSKPQALLTMQEKLRAQRTALYHRCQTEEIELPTVTRADVGVGGARKRKSVASDVKSKGPGTRSESEFETQTTLDERGFISVSEAFATPEPESGAPTKKTTTDLAKQAAQHLVGIDFTTLPQHLRVATSAAFKEKMATLDYQIEKKHEDITKIAPNLKAEDKFKSMASKVKRTTEDFESAQDAKVKTHRSFIAIKERRQSKFEATVKEIQTAVSAIYNMLTNGTRGDAAGTAYLLCEEMDEQYLGGTKYHAAPPNKTFREMDLLSGGEKTIAALALLFAIHKVCPSPFFVLDEVDAALDQGNVDKVINYVQASKKHCQFLVISLKSCFYETASSLVGVHKDRSKHSSGIVTCDLTRYDQRPQ
eukprot:Rhum_TRINITY_DN20631_c0_g1::Rhum_TRINITY_DN20631_c0_g1_i1::g.171651::m.171651/K06636/SMC1; structural maintenance of chromosome 1